MNKNKYEYFEILQLEYIVADVRFQFYHRQKDKAMWLRFKEAKKAKILEMAKTLGFPTLFSDTAVYNLLAEKVYVGKSYPEFFYKDQTFRDGREFWDKYNYYFPGKLVHVTVNGWDFKALIRDFHTNEHTKEVGSEVLVEKIDKDGNPTKRKLWVPLCCVSRIFEIKEQE
jgi:hypothetical protein